MPASDSPVVTLILGLVFVLIGGGGGGYVVALRKDRRRGKTDDVSILNEVRKVAREAVTEVNADLRTERRRTDRLERRVEQLTDILRDKGIRVPAWSPVLQAVGDEDGG